MQKTTPFLMFTGDQCGKAEEAMRLYTSLIPNSAIKSIEYFGQGEPGGEDGCVKQGVFTLDGVQYRALDSAIPHGFTFTPAFSIFVECATEAEIDTLFAKLSEGGSTMMPLGSYGFSKKFGWLSDRYGVSWQLNLQS